MERRGMPGMGMPGGMDRRDMSGTQEKPQAGNLVTPPKTTRPGPAWQQRNNN
jgi:hypothetical protein